MKNVYIDILITINIFIDYFLLLCTKKIIGSNVGYKRIILGSITGGVTSLSALLPVLPSALNLLIDFTFAMLIVFITFGRCEIKAYIKRVLVFFTVSFLFGGIMIFIYLNFKPYGMGIYNDVVYFDISPILLIIMTLICYYILRILKKLTNNVYKTDICNTEVHINGKIFIFTAKIDTGCNLKEPFSGNSVIIAEKSILEGFLPDKNKIRIIPFESMGGSGIIKGFAVDKVIIDGKILAKPIYLGICENILKGDVKALIPYEIIN